MKFHSAKYIDDINNISIWTCIFNSKFPSVLSIMWWLSVILFINFPNSETHTHPHVHPAIIPDPLPHPSATLNEELSLWWGLCACHVALFYIISDLSKTSGSRYCYPQFTDETIAIQEMIVPEITGHVSNYSQVQTHTCLGSCVCFSHHIMTLAEFPWLISHLPLTHSPELNKVTVLNTGLII